MWTVLLLGITTYSHTHAEVRPSYYDPEEYANCGKSVHSKMRMITIDNDPFGTHYVKKVAGGKPVTVGEMPWMTRIWVRNLETGKNSTCTGALISKKHVLTAAHCFRLKNAQGEKNCKRAELKTMEIIVNVGATKLIAGSSVEERGVERIIVRKHMDQKYYDENCTTGDMAILELKTAVPVDKYPPICLLDRDEAATNMGYRKTISEKAYISGYGRTPLPNSGVLYQAMIAPINSCTFGGVPMACTNSTLTQGRGACEGDSGAPLAVLLNSRYYAYGVFTRGKCDNTTKAVTKNVFERLSAKMGELRKIIK